MKRNPSSVVFISVEFLCVSSIVLQFSFRMRYPIVGGDRRCSSAVELETGLEAEEEGGETAASDGRDGGVDVVLCCCSARISGVENEEGKGQEPRAFA